MPPALEGGGIPSTTITAADTKATTAALGLPPLPIFTALASHPASKPAIIDYQADSAGSTPPQPHTYHSLLKSTSLGRLHLLQLYGGGGGGGDVDPPPSLHGARVAFLAANSYEWVATLFAIWAAGGIAVPLCTSHPVKEMAYVVADSGAGLVLATRGFLDKIEEVVGVVRGEEKGVRIQVAGIEDLFTTTPLQPTPPPQDLDVWLKKRALIIYTSGTTSLPKGVVTTHLNLTTQSHSLLRAWEYSPTDHLLHILPLHHVHGILNCTLTPLLSGGTVEFLPLPFSPAKTLMRLAQGARGEREKVTLLMAVPTIYARLLGEYNSPLTTPQQRQDITLALSGLRLAVSGSAGLPTSVRTAWSGISNGGTLLERYGMTELGMAVSCGIDCALRPEGAVGWVLPGYEIGLRCIDEEPQPQQPVQTPRKIADGEILVRGPGVFIEYWNRPRITTEKEFLPAGYTPGLTLTCATSPFPPLPTPPFRTSTSTYTSTSTSTYPWFKTGDFARLPLPPSSSPSPSPSIPPPLTILGRLNTDILKSGGEKLSALEIEHEILLLPLPIREAAVVGLPSQKWGDLVAAVVVLDTHSQEEEEEEGEEWLEERVEREVKAEMKKRVAPYKVPKVVRVVESLGRNAMGKVTKGDLVKRVFPEWRADEN